MSRIIRVEGVRKSNFVPDDIKNEYETDCMQFLDEQIDYMEEEIKDEICGLRLERDFLTLARLT